MVAEQVLCVLPIHLRSVFRAEVDGPSVILRYNNPVVASNTRANHLYDAEVALDEAGYIALSVGWDIYVSGSSTAPAAVAAGISSEREPPFKVFDVSVDDLRSGRYK